MRPILFVAGVPVWLLCACDAPSSPDPATSPAFAAIATTDHASVPISLFQFIPCANGGAGEFVLLAGNISVLSHATFNDAGHFTIKSQFRPQGVVGIGETSGARYHGTGVTQDIFTARKGFTETFINSFRMVAPGPGNNFSVHEEFHVTVDARGRVTVLADHFRARCR